ncbi:hypothetical protein A9Q99_12590 [Gammaproteobacteria bacterium 45_16_T64]|nr:hypothetical protein A9Q99_12590 [Gammaproteobacteria bacterium 45_16_T64]
MGHVIVVFGTLIALNFGVGFMVSDYLYEDETKQGVVEVQEVAPEQAESAVEVEVPVEPTAQ